MGTRSKFYHFFRYKKKEILNLDMDFLHEGYPKKILKSKKFLPKKIKSNNKRKINLSNALLKILSSPNIFSKEFISLQYDHEVQGTSIIKPLQGKGRVFSDSTAIKPLFNSKKCIVTSQGIYPNYSNLDAYKMAACSIDTAIRNLIVTGCNLLNIALLDNFCWCSPEEPEKIYQLKDALKACYDLSTKFCTPFISGKDSMYNDFNGYDKKNRKVKISIPPTLLISSIGIIKDYNDLLSIVPRKFGDLIFIIGKTDSEICGSEYEKVFGYENGSIPKVDKDIAKRNYNNFIKANKKKLINSAISVGLGGAAVSLAKMSIASQMGLKINLSNIQKTNTKIKSTHILFSESQSRIITTISPSNRKEFETYFEKTQLSFIGKVIKSKKIICKLSRKEKFEINIKSLEDNYKKNLFSL